MDISSFGHHLDEHEVSPNNNQVKVTPEVKLKEKELEERKDGPAEEEKSDYGADEIDLNMR